MGGGDGTTSRPMKKRFANDSRYSRNKETTMPRAGRAYPDFNYRNIIPNTVPIPTIPPRSSSASTSERISRMAVTS